MGSALAVDRRGYRTADRIFPASPLAVAVAALVSIFVTYNPVSAEPPFDDEYGPPGWYDCRVNGREIYCWVPFPYGGRVSSYPSEPYECSNEGAAYWDNGKKSFVMCYDGAWKAILNDDE